MAGGYQTELFISYAWEDESEAGRKRGVVMQGLTKALQHYGIKAVYDRRGGVGYNESIPAFMQRIGQGNYVILLISDKYLRSKYCMQEVLEVFSVRGYEHRVFPLVFDDARIYSATNRAAYLRYWDDKISALKRELQNSTPGHDASLRKELDLYLDIRRITDRFASFISSRNTLKAETHLNNEFHDLINAIFKRMLVNSGYPDNERFIRHFKLLRTTPGLPAQQLKQHYRSRRDAIISARDKVKGTARKRAYTQKLEALKNAYNEIAGYAPQTAKAPEKSGTRSKIALWGLLLAGAIALFAGAYFYLTPAAVVLQTNETARLNWNGGESMHIKPGNPLKLELKPGHYLFEANSSDKRETQYASIRIHPFTIEREARFRFSKLDLQKSGFIEVSQEEKDYKKAVNSDDPKVLKQFLNDYPNSPQKETIRKLLSIYRKQESTGSGNKEERDFKIAKNIETVEAVRNFIEKYPNGNFIEPARQLLNRLLEERRRKRDHQDFKVAEKRNDSTAFRNYLEAHPNGAFVDEAQEHLRKLRSNFASTLERESYLSALAVNTLAAYYSFMDEYPDSRYTGVLKAKIDSLKGELSKQGMAFIPGGTFHLEAAGEPVQLTSFFIDRNEVTVKEYRAFCNATGRVMPDAPGYSWHDNFPVVNVSWYDARAYAEWKGKQLPTEAQWEYAANLYRQSLHTTNTYDMAWVNNNSYKRPHPAGQKLTGKFELSDMLGNVWEWCRDYYKKNPSPGSKLDPAGPENGSFRVIKGASFENPAEMARPDIRNSLMPATKDESLGFRCVRVKVQKIPQ